MTDKKLQKARNFIKKNPYLIWHTKNYDQLSAESIFEAVINYGNWDDFKNIRSIFGIKELSTLFLHSQSSKRSNLKPQTKNYFQKYFFKYA